jgi:hypothetical protein
MYNPDYCSRPHVVALNKMDLEDAGALAEEVAGEVAAAGRRLVEQYPDHMGPPAAIVPCSAATGGWQCTGVRQLWGRVGGTSRQGNTWGAGCSLGGGCCCLELAH